MPARHTFRHRLTSTPWIILFTILRAFPIHLTLWMGMAAGWIIGNVIRYRNKVVVDNLRRAFPECSEQEIQKRRADFWIHMGLVIAENTVIGSARQLRKMTWVEDENNTVSEEEIIQRGGTIGVTGHCGSFEMLLPHYAHLSKPFTAVAQPLHNGYLNDFITKNRRNVGIDVMFTNRGVSSDLLIRLKRGEIVGFVSDADARDHGVFVDFFGQPTSTPRGPAKMALWSGRPIVPVFCVRDGLRRFRIITSEPIWPPENPPDQDIAVRDLTQAYVHEIEKIVRRYPAQYLWGHRRWKTVPKNVRTVNRKRAGLCD